MAENDKQQKKISEKINERKPATFRIDTETADKLRGLCKDFANQDIALNAIMAAYERECLVNTLPQYAEEMRQFEQYQQCLGAKFTDMLKALATADERAKIDVQQLLDSKDSIIQDLQKRNEEAVKGREVYENLLHDESREKRILEDKLEEERLISQGLRAEMKEKEMQMNSSLQDKIQLNEILSQTVAEKQRELDKVSGYPQLMEEKEEQVRVLSGRVHELENKAREDEYAHRLALLEKDKQLEAEKAQMRQKQEEQMDRIRDKYETEIEKLREKNEAMQSQIQELMAK